MGLYGTWGALILGVLVGWIAGDKTGYLTPVVGLILNSFKFVMMPIILCSIVVVLKNSSPKHIRKLGIYTVGVFSLLSLIGIGVAFFSVQLMAYYTIPKISGFESVTPRFVTAGQIISSIVPSNLIEALGQGSVQQAIVCAILIGIGIRLTGDAGNEVGRFFDSAYAVSKTWASWLIKGMPVFVFILMAWGVGQFGKNALTSMTMMVTVLAISVSFQMFIVYPLIVRFGSRISVRQFMSSIWPVWATAAATTSAGSTLPLTLSTMRTRLGVSESVAGFVAPLGASMNKGGTAIFQIVSVFTLCKIYGIHLGLIGGLNLGLTVFVTVFGTGSIPGAGLIGLTVVIQSLGFPIEGIALIAAVDRVSDMLRTSTNVVGDCVAATVVEKIC
ncbi:dicarboxylate/amino acid:cation symporter [bacterium]|nr:dicarboxylate/amino acid:cation symporter [bacterium]